MVNSGFQFMPLREGHPLGVFVLVRFTMFQFMPLREGHPTVRSTRCALILFQFMPLREGHHIRHYKTSGLTRFQFMPLREGHPPFGMDELADATQFQFMPLREGHRVCPGNVQRGLCVSIHAPTGGASISASMGRMPRISFNSCPYGRGI